MGNIKALFKRVAVWLGSVLLVMFIANYHSDLAQFAYWAVDEPLGWIDREATPWIIDHTVGILN